MGLLKEQYREAWTFFNQRVRRPFLFCVTLFVVTGVASWLLLLLYPATAYELFQQLSALIQEKGITQSDGSLALGRLLWNNLQASLFSIFYGLIPFLCISCLSVFLNAAILGVVAAMYSLIGLSPVLFAAGILPHGIFEIPALLLSGALGLRLCITLTRMILKKYGPLEFQETLYGLLQLYFLWIVPLFILAAIIECTVTPLLLTWLS